MSPGEGMRPKRKAECTLGMKRSSNGPTSAREGSRPRRSTSTTWASGTPSSRQSRTHEREPYTVAPVAFAIAGTSST